MSRFVPQMKPTAERNDVFELGCSTVEDGTRFGLSIVIFYAEWDYRAYQSRMRAHHYTTGHRENRPSINDLLSNTHHARLRGGMVKDREQDTRTVSRGALLRVQL